MGSVAVLVMEDDARQTGHAGNKIMHPFFTAKRSTKPTATPDTDDTPPDSNPPQDQLQETIEKPNEPKPTRKRHKATADAQEEEEDGPQEKKPRPRKKAKASGCASITSHFTRLNGKDETANTSNAEAAQPTAPETPNQTDDKAPNKDKRTPTSGRGRKRKTHVVQIKYGDDVDSRLRIGRQIAAILEDAIRQDQKQAEMGAVKGVKISNGHAPPSPKKNPQSNASTKKIHPLFLGKPKSSDAPTPKSPVPKLPKERKSDGSLAAPRMKLSMATPCSPKKTRPLSTNPNSNLKTLQFRSNSHGLKFPGAKQPAWPWKDMVHVRGEPHMASHLGGPPSVPLSRKSKGHAVDVLPGESVVNHFTAQLNVPEILETLRNINHDEFLPPPPELRRPVKHLESGSKLQKRIAPQLKSWTRSSAGSKRGSGPDGSPDVMLPQLDRLYNLLRTGLSAFDKGQCETNCWAQKYAPVAAVEVLQVGREAFLLRDWVQALKIQSVDKGSAGADNSKGNPKPNTTKKAKKRKKLDDLDDFIVSGDEEIEEMEELADDEYVFTPSGKFGIMQKTVIRKGDVMVKAKEGMPLTNTILISGPHGCGKTAAVYAVAKELGFEIFEINSSSRRTGKDVLDRIGDMTRNHLVQHHGTETKRDGGLAAQAANELADETAEEVKTGKQATMNSFFMPKSTAPKAKKAAKPALPAVKEVKKAPRSELPKSQKQSLILLEEVDVLYEEDKQFWTTVIGLIAQSKRPFIMTCNDETRIPKSTWDTLVLHGIFRFSPPPTDLAVDRLLLIAANEGHALKRAPVEALYHSRDCDLRAATMDLNYWCQIGVGDRRGGFDWLYPRWPKGSDVDENGEVVRVISEDTYSTGMNWLCRNTVANESLSPMATEEELVDQAWDFWQIDLGSWHESTASWTGSCTEAATSAVRRHALDAFGDYAEAMSVADLCSSGSFASLNEISLDTTLPEPSTKTREDNVQGVPPLDTPPMLRYCTTAKAMPTTIKSVARQSLRRHQGSSTLHQHGGLAPLTECKAVERILETFTNNSPRTPVISRVDYALAFDIIAVSDTSSTQSSSLDPSVFDRTLKMITLDVAPYVRSIVAYEARLQSQRLKLSSLVSEGGQAGRSTKKMRTTRAALSALEGGMRSTTRRERWFTKGLNSYLVMRTGSEAWQKALWAEMGEEDVSSIPQDSPSLSQNSEDKENVFEERPPPAKKRGRPKKRVVADDDSADDLA